MSRLSRQSFARAAAVRSRACRSVCSTAFSVRFARPGAAIGARSSRAAGRARREWKQSPRRWRPGSAARDGIRRSRIAGRDGPDSAGRARPLSYGGVAPGPPRKVFRPLIERSSSLSAHLMWVFTISGISPPSLERPVQIPAHRNQRVQRLADIAPRQRVAGARNFHRSGIVPHSCPGEPLWTDDIRPICATAPRVYGCVHTSSGARPATRIGLCRAAPICSTQSGSAPIPSRRVNALSVPSTPAAKWASGIDAAPGIVAQGRVFRSAFFSVSLASPTPFCILPSTCLATPSPAAQVRLLRQGRTAAALPSQTRARYSVTRIGHGSSDPRGQLDETKNASLRQRLQRRPGKPAIASCSDGARAR